MRLNGSASRSGPDGGAHDRPISPPPLRQRAYGAPPLPGYAAMARDSFDAAGMTPQGSTQLLNVSLDSSAPLEVQGPPPAPPPEGRRNPWRHLCACWGQWRGQVTVEGVQGFNQRGWLGHFIRWMPLVGAIIGCVSLYFAIRNFKLIYAARTYSLLQQTRPMLVQANNDILAGLAKIQRVLGINDTSKPLPPLPPERTFPHPGR